MIEVDAVHKSFVSGRGREAKVVEAVRGVSFRATDARITALLGPNGAGKTTTLRMAAAQSASTFSASSSPGASIKR